MRKENVIKSYKNGMKLMKSLLSNHEVILNKMKILNKMMFSEDFPQQKILIFRRLMQKMKRTDDAYEIYLDGLNNYYNNFLNKRKLGKMFVKKFLEMSEKNDNLRNVKKNKKIKKKVRAL